MSLAAGLTVFEHRGPLSFAVLLATPSFRFLDCVFFRSCLFKPKTPSRPWSSATPALDLVSSELHTVRGLGAKARLFRLDIGRLA